MSSHADQARGSARSGSSTTEFSAKSIAAVVALALLVIFFLQNLQDVEIHFLMWTWNTGMIWALLFSAIAGAIASAAIATLRRRSKARQAPSRPT